MFDLELTDRQLEVLRTLFALTEKRGYAPTIRELGNKLGIESTNAVKDHLKALKKRGLIEWTPNRARTLRLTQRGLDLLLARAA